MSKKRILIIMSALNGGGAEKVLVDLLRHFDYSLFDVTLSLEYADGIYINQIPTNVRQRPLFNSKGSLVRKALKWIYHKFHFISPLKYWLLLNERNHYDTMISFMESEPVLYHYCLMKRADRHVSWVHTDFVRHHWSKNMFVGNDERNVYRLMDMVVFVSATTKMQFLKIYDLPTNRLSVIHNFVDMHKIQLHCHNNRINHIGMLIICSVGRLGSVKRFDKLIDAASLLVQRKNNVLLFEVWIIGDGPDRESLEEQIQRLHLEKVVKLKGFHQPPYEMMAQTDVFISTSEAEGFPIAMSEAMCLGLPVIATDTAGAQELLSGGYGFIVNHSVDSIANALESFLDNRGMITEYRTKSFKRASELFDNRKQLFRIQNIL